jgi:hypothetical protein
MPRLRLPTESLVRIADRLGSVRGFGELRTLLAQMDPAAWAKVKRGNWREWYAALCASCNKRFPVWEGAVDQWAMEADGLNDVMAYGIPLDLHGIDDESAFDVDSVAMAVGVIERHELHSMVPSALQAHADLVRPMLKANEETVPIRIRVDGTQTPAEAKAKTPPIAKPMRGWVFAAKWSGWPVYRDYMLSKTGNGFLDYSMFDEMELPDWNMAEINDLQQQWARALPVWNQITAFIKFIDSNPTRTLPVLVRLWMGDKSVLPLVSVKKVTHG